MSSSSPKHKRLKPQDGGSPDDPKSWRDKAIDKFDLRRVPNEWKDAVAAGDEDAWKRYYEYRSEIDDVDEEDPDHYDPEEDPETGTYLREWKQTLAQQIKERMKDDCPWPWSPVLGCIDWEDCEYIRTAHYFSHVWSPYAIPHAIELMHRYHGRSRMNSVEFSTAWSYRLVDFADEDSVNNERMKVLCSDHFEDEELRADIIEVDNLTKKTCRKLRKFLFGSRSDESKRVTCTDYDFWLLIFGFMGTTNPDLANDPYHCNLGYSWTPNRQERKMLYKLKAKEGNEDDDDFCCDPGKPFDEYYPDGCSWLKHRVMEITDGLGPVLKHYHAPTVQDAIGWTEEWQEEQDERGHMMDALAAARMHGLIR